MKISSSSNVHSKILIKTCIQIFNSLGTIVLTAEQLRSFFSLATLISQLNLNLMSSSLNIYIWTRSYGQNNANCITLRLLVFPKFGFKVLDIVSSLCFASLIFRIICNIRLMYHVITFKIPQIEFVEQCWFSCTSIPKFQMKRARCAMIHFAQRICITDVF